MFSSATDLPGANEHGHPVAIVFAGTNISCHGDQIAELTGLGRLWIGVVLLVVAEAMSLWLVSNGSRTAF